MTYPYYILNPTEAGLLKWLADRRYRESRAKGIKDQRKAPGDYDVFDPDQSGTAGELAFGRIWNYAYNFGDGPDDFDFIDENGDTWDVKTTKYHTGHLLVGDEKDLSKITYFALMVGSIPRFEYRGLFPARELREHPNDYKRNDRTGLWVHQNQLLKIDHFELREKRYGSK
jgi:hypothetical protein